MYVHWQPRIDCVIAEIPKEQARLLVNDIVMLTEECNFSTKAVEILLANLRKELPDD